MTIYTFDDFYKRS